MARFIDLTGQKFGKLQELWTLTKISRRENTNAKNFTSNGL